VALGLSFLAFYLISKKHVNQLDTPATNIQVEEIIQKEKSSDTSLSSHLDTHKGIKTENETIDKSIMNNQKEVDSLLSTGKKVEALELFNYVKKKPEIITLLTQKDTTIICKEGTILRIMANSFLHSDTNEIANGTVKLKVTEYYTLADMLLANLSTQSNEQILETGGMVYIEAYSQEQPLKLNKEISIEIPTKDKKKDMQLFTGEETSNGINWALDNTSEADRLIESTIFKETANVPFAVIEEVPSFPECQAANNELIKECVSNKFKRIINRRFNKNLFQEYTTNSKLRIFASFTINKEGKIVNVRSSPSLPGIQEEVERVLSLVPELSPGKQNSLTVNTLYSLPIIIRFDELEKNRIPTDMDRDTTSFRTSSTYKSTIVYDTIFESKRTIIEDIKEILHNNEADVNGALVDRYKNFKKKRLIQERKINGEPYVFIRKIVIENPDSGFMLLPTDSVTRGGNVIRKRWNNTQIPDRQVSRLVPQRPGNDYYLFTTSRLGWLNCDRFLRSTIPLIKYKIKIKNSKGAKAKMVFKSRRSILAGRRTENSFDFGNVPQDELVTLVAIRIVDNKYQLALKDVFTQNTGDLELEFKTYDIKDLQNELKKLNPSF
jgi:hypothetical protein